MSNQNRQWNPIAAGDWELSAYHETVMAFERTADATAAREYQAAISTLEDIAIRATPVESAAWQRIDRLRARTQIQSAKLQKARGKR